MDVRDADECAAGSGRRFRASPFDVLVGGATMTGDVFVLHPKQRPDECLTLSGQDLVRVKRLLDGVVGEHGDRELAEAAVVISGRLDGYFSGLR
jgi:hypothetical protein